MGCAPVEEKKVQSDHGTVTYISFADGSITSLTQDEQNSLEQLENVLSETYVADPGLQWTMVKMPEEVLYPYSKWPG